MNTKDPTLSGASIASGPASIPPSLKQPSMSVTTGRYSLDISDMMKVEKYCLDTIENVRAINAASQTPSAFCCILEAMCFFASLSSTKRAGKAACGKNIKKVSGYKAEFVDFVKRYMDSRYHNIAGDLYSVVRCGLCHTMSIVAKSTQQPFVLTHDSGHYQHLSLIKTLPSCPLVLVADSLCNDVKKAVKAMFSKANKTISINIKAKPPIAAYFTN